MKTLANAQLGRALNEFISDLQQNPVINEKFIANFSLSGDQSGVVEFRHLHSARIATAQWSVYIDDGRIQIDLKYNDQFVLMRSETSDFRKQLATKISVF